MPLLGNISMGAMRMSKYISKAARKRLPLHPKHARKGFYKGNKCASTGITTSTGKRSLHSSLKCVHGHHNIQWYLDVLLAVTIMIMIMLCRYDHRGGRSAYC